jgi:hypothetical protein
MMSNNEIKPHWMRELARLAGNKTQLYLHGNIKDTMLYPLGVAQEDWTLGPLREALFEIFRYQIGQYDLIGAYNPVDGLVFADARDANRMGELFDALLLHEEQKAIPLGSDHAPQPAPPQNPLEQALQQMRVCLDNGSSPCLFIIENASQMLAGPVNLQPAERTSFLRLLKASAESRLVSVTGKGDRRAVQNTLLLLCDKLTDLPAWLYFNNPFAGSIDIETPKGQERRHFFDLYLRPDEESARTFAVDDLVDLTEGMTMRDLCGIRALARHAGDAQRNAKALTDSYKFGAQESEWDNLDWARLSTAEATLAARVIGQPAAVNAVADVLRRARLHLSGAQHSSRSKPRGVLFFAGPTGVGKTELAKAIAELVFHNDEACVRFDMSEYSQPNSDQRLLGAPPGYVGYEEGGQLTNRIKANPFSVLLFDEIEKAHPTVLDKFLQILEDGRMTDGRGETAYFSESIVIFTSNVGIYKLDPATRRPLVDPLSGKPVMQVDPNIDTEYAAVKSKVLEGVQNYFKHVLGRPELLNRIGQNIVVFDFIHLPVMREILERRVLRSIAAQVRERWQLDVEFAPAVVDQVMAFIGGDISAGGRGVGNLAELVILNPLARVMFSLLETGQTVSGKRLLVSGVQAPQQGAAERYELAWKLL